METSSPGLEEDVHAMVDRTYRLAATGPRVPE
jgi:hypothetical protein